MLCFLCLLVLSVLHGAFTQRCVPNPVSNIELDINGTLHWNPSTNCPGTSYVVYIIDGATEQYYYETRTTSFDISHLPACIDHLFEISAMSDYIMSTQRQLTAKTPADPETQSPTIRNFLATPEGEGVQLEWDVDPEYAHCVLYYRVVVWDGESIQEDRYSFQKDLVVSSLTPCSSYEFTVTCVFNNVLEGRIALINYETPQRIADPPTLEYVRPGVSYIDMNWVLPSYSSNRCPITSFIVDASPYANLSIPIADSPARSPVAVHVDSLQSDRMYLFRVTLVNSAGNSGPIPVAIQTLLP